MGAVPGSHGSSVCGGCVVSFGPLAGLWESPVSYFESSDSFPPWRGEAFSPLGEHLLKPMWLRGPFPLAGLPSPVDSK